jgi:hypothetical protein
MIDLELFKADASSQGGENGILAKIFEVIGITHRTLVDVGAFDLEALSNVYPLWRHDGWRALLIESNGIYYRRMRRVPVPERVKILNAMASPGGERSLDAIFHRESIPADFDLLSIDVDGVDYHLWQSLHDHRPRVVVIEYNATIPPHLSVVGRREGNDIGASARALVELGARKGYTVVACTQTNLIFVTADRAGAFKNAGELERLFDPYALNYVMTGYDGGLLYSNRFFPWGYNPFSRGVGRDVESGGPFFVPRTGLGFYLAARGKNWWRAFRRRRLKPVVLSLLDRVDP